MFPNPRGGLSLIRVLSGINKSLNIVKEVIPIYESISPVFGNIKKSASLLKDFNLPKKNTVNLGKKSTTIKSSTNNINSPSFFQ